MKKEISLKEKSNSGSCNEGIIIIKISKYRWNKKDREKTFNDKKKRKKWEKMKKNY